MAALIPVQDDNRALRADAQRNRERIVAAARAVFAEQGRLDVPLEAIADRAGVGIATLYRRFPTREELVAAAFEGQLRAYAAVAEEALGAADPWVGFCGFIERICAMQAADRGFGDILTMSLGRFEHSESRARVRRAVVELIRRAQEAGELREDFVPEDVLLVLMANAGLVHATQAAAPHAWRRIVAFLLESFRADRNGPLPAAPTPEQMYRALAGNASTKGVCPSAVKTGAPIRE